MVLVICDVRCLRGGLTTLRAEVRFALLYRRNPSRRGRGAQARGRSRFVMLVKRMGLAGDQWPWSKGSGLNGNLAVHISEPSPEVFSFLAFLEAVFPFNLLEVRLAGDSKPERDAARGSSGPFLRPAFREDVPREDTTVALWPLSRPLAVALRNPGG